MVVRTKEAARLRHAISRVLRKQGYSVRQNCFHLPQDPTKDVLRNLNLLAVKHKLGLAEPRISRYENQLLRYIANGSEVIPSKVAPRLVLVQPESEHELLFRYVSLHWSIPVSPGYGRRLRFLVFDESNGKLIGLFGLGDPVFSLRSRDEWIGWDSHTREKNLYHVMDAYVLGSVPPYSTLLGGKLVAMLALSNEVRTAFRHRYSKKCSIIKRTKRLSYLALLTTTSALGRSSIYNRIRLDGFDFWRSVGFTQGSGEFHFSNGIYSSIRSFVERHCKPTAKKAVWGKGFRNKREVVRKCLPKIGLSEDLLYHGIKREIFVASLGADAVRFLKGEVKRPRFYDWPADRLVAAFKNRWLLPRAERCPFFREFDRESYRLWPSPAVGPGGKE